MDKKKLSERDICTKFITPAITNSGWDIQDQIREEVTFTDGRVLLKGNKHERGKKKRADYILYHKPNIPLAVIEAKDNNHSIDSGIQQALKYSDILNIPFVFSSNGDGFLFHDKTTTGSDIETNLNLNSFPSPGNLWNKYRAWKKIDNSDKLRLIETPYYLENSEKNPRYYQTTAINKVIEAITENKKRILLVMATGTGKTYTMFNIIWKLWKSNLKKRILFLTDRNFLIDQTKINDFKPLTNFRLSLAFWLLNF